MLSNKTHRSFRWLMVGTVMAVLATLLVPTDSDARNPIRRDFFDVYPAADGSRLDDLPSNAGHCGVCHFDFDGSGVRNPYGLAVEIAINSNEFPNNEAAIASLDGEDSDGDGFSNGVEITDTVNFGNTPTFPGLSAGNVDQAYNVDLVDIEGYLTPSGGTDVDPPEVIVLAPTGGESFEATSTQLVQWSATDASGIASVDVFLSTDGGGTFHPVARGLSGVTSYDWFVPRRPGVASVVRVEARDGAGNFGHGDGGAFTITSPPGGIVPTTLRDFDMPGTQPLMNPALDTPGDCATCHGGYDAEVEPYHNWHGSMMGQAMRDPLFTATMVVAEQEAPGSGDLCLRCHTPSGWLEGRSTDTTGGQLIARDFESIHCDFCHSLVDPVYEPGVSPPVDLAILDDLADVPPDPANGQFVVDPAPVRRGPYADAQADHQFLESPFHRESDLCGTCHDVSNPVFVLGAGPDEYVPDTFDATHPDGDRRNMFPVERTFSEWTQSEYATSGVYAPQFAGNKPDGIVSSCQDCHMRDVSGRGAAGGPNRTDLPLHDLMGGNHFVPDILPVYFPDDVDAAALADGKARALSMLSLAATMDLAQEGGQGVPTVTVTVINETGHKLPSGYPEGRRIWLNLRAYDGDDALVYESGAYDFATGVLTHDTDAKIYEIKPGISTRLAAIISLPAGPSFHFALNDTIYADNRIPPRGFTNAAFAAVQAAPVAYTYADGQYADATSYTLPLSAVRAVATLYYQTTSLEYITFLRDANTTDDSGQILYDAWVAQGRCAPVVMTSAEIALDPVAVDPDDVAMPSAVTYLAQNAPNPFNPATVIRFGLRAAGPTRIRIYDERGRLVVTLLDEVLDAGRHEVRWPGTDDGGRRVASGVYHYTLETDGKVMQRKMTLVK